MSNDALVSSLMGLSAMHDSGFITDASFEADIETLCSEYGTEFVARAMVLLGIV